MTDYLVLINELSGRAGELGAEAIEDDLRPVFRGHGEPEFLTGSFDELAAAAKTFCGKGLVTVGGDGTIGGIANVLQRRTDPPVLIPLPYGTANLVPLDLEMSLTPSEALAQSLGAPIRKIDFVRMGDIAMLHSTLFGTFAEMAEDREDLRKAPTFGDAIGAVTTLIDHFLSAESDTYRLTLDGQAIEVETSAVFVVNGPVRAGEGVAPRRDSLDGGKLIVYISRQKGLFSLMQHIFDGLTVGLEASDELVRAEASEVIIEGLGRELHYAIDGEPGVSKEQLHFRMFPQDLLVPDLRGSEVAPSAQDG
jgi:diacylglycerol kinase family enzyme